MTSVQRRSSLRRPLVPTQLVGVADRQSDVLTRRQLTAAGVTRSQVRGAVTARRWQALGRQVVVLDNAELTPAQRRWAAVLLPGKPAALAGPTAAALAGLSGFDDDLIHVVMAADSNTRWPSWVAVHNSRRFSPAEVMGGAGPPRTRPARSVIDAAAWQPYVNRAVAMLCAAVQQRVTTAPQLAAELSIAGSVRHVAMMREVLDDIGGGAHTLDELALTPLARRAGLPAPRRQVLRRDADGKRRYVDAEFDLPDGHRLVVEIDGAVHLRPQTMWDDMAHQNELVIDGSTVLRFSSMDIRRRPAHVIGQLKRVRAAHARN